MAAGRRRLAKKALETLKADLAEAAWIGEATVVEKQAEKGGTVGKVADAASQNVVNAIKQGDTMTQVAISDA